MWLWKGKFNPTHWIYFYWVLQHRHVLLQQRKVIPLNYAPPNVTQQEEVIADYSQLQKGKSSLFGHTVRSTLCWHLIYSWDTIFSSLRMAYVRGDLCWRCRRQGRCLTTFSLEWMCHYFVLEDGYFLEWTEWSECVATCGDGLQLRSRECVPPRFGGEPCEGDAMGSQPCSVDITCPGNSVSFPLRCSPHTRARAPPPHTHIPDNGYHVI